MTVYLPDEIRAGVTFIANVTLTAYPASTWTMTLIMRGPEAIDLSAVADGNTHVLRADAATTAAWQPGTYQVSLRVSDGTDVIEADTGSVVIMPDLAGVGAGHDGRSHIQKVLEAIEAVIEGRATRDQESYKINNRELVRTPIEQLLKLRQTYREEARRERAAERGQSLLGRRVLVRF